MKIGTNRLCPNMVKTFKNLLLQTVVIWYVELGNRVMPIHKIPWNVLKILA